MQISKTSLLLCALTLCGGMTLRANDTAAQATARAALMQKMNQLGGATAAPQKSIPAKSAPVKTQISPAATSAPAATASAVETSTTAGPEDTRVQAAARAALEKKLQQMGGCAPAASSATASSMPAPKETPVVTTPAPATTAPANVSSGSGDTPAQAAARTALEKKMQTSGGYIPAPSSTATGKMGEAQVVAPAPPVNMSKVQKLRWLNSLYEANKVSPKEYQQQRAAILKDH